MSRKPFVVLVGMDFSELADRALRQAFALAARYEKAQVHVVCVVPGLHVDAPSSDPFVVTEMGVEEGVLESLRARVRTLWREFVAHEEGSSTLRLEQLRSHVRLDSPATGIVQLAAEVHADLIVMGTHGRQCVPWLSLGSVAENTVRYASCPVLVVPPEAHGLHPALSPTLGGHS